MPRTDPDELCCGGQLPHVQVREHDGWATFRLRIEWRGSTIGTVVAAAAGLFLPRPPTWLRDVELCVRTTTEPAGRSPRTGLACPVVALARTATNRAWGRLGQG